LREKVLIFRGRSRMKTFDTDETPPTKKAGGGEEGKGIRI
jgi:hypothetical protein